MVVGTMKISLASVLVLALAVEGSTWFGKLGMYTTESLFAVTLILGTVAYNKWHETELERWLSDHNVPYPTPADRKDLEDLVKKNWDSKVVTPYAEWETPQLLSYLKSKGKDVHKGTETNKKALASQVKSSWTDSSDSASDSYHSMKDWIFDRSSLTIVRSPINTNALYAAGPIRS